MSELPGPIRASRLVWVFRAAGLLLLTVAVGLYWQAQGSSSDRMGSGKYNSVPTRPAVQRDSGTAAVSAGAMVRTNAEPGTRSSKGHGGGSGATGSFWQSAAESERRWQLNLSEELADAVGQLAGVNRARVFLNLAPATGFQAASARAAVLIDPLPGGHLPRSIVDTVRRLVACAVPNLAAEQIAVIDTRSGRVLDLPPGLSPQAAMTLDEAALRQASNVQARIGESLADMEGTRVEVWPLGPPADEQQASYVLKEGSEGAGKGDGSERTQPLDWHLAARVTVAGEELLRLDPQAADSEQAWQRAGSRLAAGVRSKIGQVAPTMLPEEIVVDFEPPAEKSPATGRLSSPHLMVGLVICALLAGYAWGRPTRATVRAEQYNG